MSMHFPLHRCLCGAYVVDLHTGLNSAKFFEHYSRFVRLHDISLPIRACLLASCCPGVNVFDGLLIAAAIYRTEKWLTRTRTSARTARSRGRQVRGFQC